MRMWVQRNNNNGLYEAFRQIAKKTTASFERIHSIDFYWMKLEGGHCQMKVDVALSSKKRKVQLIKAQYR